MYVRYVHTWYMVHTGTYTWVQHYTLYRRVLPAMHMHIYAYAYQVHSSPFATISSIMSNE